MSAMLAEARTAACKKRYKNGIGAVPAEARTAASEKGYENKIGAMFVKSDPPMTKLASSGRHSTLSLKDAW